MAMNNFTGSNPTNNAPAPPAPPAMPSMSSAAQAGSDIEELLINYNDRFKAAPPALFRDQLITLAMAVLVSKSKPNPLLIGSAGVGKTHIVEEIARLITTADPRVPNQLRGRTIYELPLSSIVAGAGIVGELETRVAALIDFVTEPKNKAILFIDEIHLLQSRDQTYQKIAQMLKPALARGDMHLIGATTGQEGRKLDDDPAFARRFSRIIVDELTPEQTVEVLKKAKAAFSAHHGNLIHVDDEMLERVVAIADTRGRAGARRPDNALTLLDRTMADQIVQHAQAVAKAQTLDPALAAALTAALPLSVGAKNLEDVSMRLLTGMAVRPRLDPEQMREDLTRVQGQDEVLPGLVEALMRDELAAFPRTKPLAWLFAGPSGVGKTETARIIAQALTNQDPILLNMAEYDSKHTTSKLIGSPPGYVGSESNAELPFDTLESNPYRVIVLDEVEKADKAVHQLLLSILNEGWLRMSSGKVVDFSKCLLIATTNAGREAMTRRPTGFSTSAGPTRLTQQELVQALKTEFTPELLGRFTRLEAFAALDREVYRRILVDYYDRQRTRILAANPQHGKYLPATLSDSLVDGLTERTYLPEQGARPAENAARTLIEDLILAGLNPPVPAAASVTDEPAQD